MSDLSTLIDIFALFGPFLKKGFNWMINRIKWNGNDEETRRIAFAFHNYSWTYTNQTIPGIANLGSIPRPEFEQIHELWRSTKAPIILHGEAGSGKSSIALCLAQDLAKNGDPVLFIKATDFPINQDPVMVIQNHLALNTKLMDSIAKLGNTRSCTIIIDQLDSIAKTELCKSMVGFLRALANLPNVNILAVSRTYELQNDETLASTAG